MNRLHIWFLLTFVMATACQPVNTSGVPTPAPYLMSPTVTERFLPTAPHTPTFTHTIPPTATFSPTSTSALPTLSATPSVLPVTTLLFTGVIVPARCVQAALDRIGNPDYPYEEVSHLISQADLAIGVFNATMSDKAEHTGCIPTYQLVGSPDNADAAARAGFDVMSVATNHIKDCGLMKAWCDDTFFDTLENLKRVGILTVGAGANLDQAMQPVVMTVNGVRFGFVSLGDSKMDESVFAADDHPGIARLTEDNLNMAITNARRVSDVVIALPHWGSEDIAIPNWLQRTQAQQLVAAGANLVIGNHTHVIQAVQDIGGIPVFYGLGNFVFDQGLRDHRQGAILLVKFQGTQYLGYEIVPTHVDQDGRVHIADSEEATEILDRIEHISQAVR